MDVTLELARYLANAGFGTLGTNIHVGQTPSEQDGIFVVITGGTVNHYNPIEEAIIDVYVRNMSADNAVTTMNQIRRHIHGMHTTLTSETYIYSILALGNVEAIERNQEYAKLYKQTYRVLFRYTGIIS